MKSIKWIVLGVVIVVLVAGAVGASAYNMGKQAGVTEGLASRDRFSQDRLGGTGGAAAAGGQGTRTAQGGSSAAAAGNFTTGQVKSISGNDLEVSTATDVTKVKLTDKTQVQKTVSGAVSDIKTGDRVVVQGAKGADGTLEANSIQLGGGRPGAGAGGSGQGTP